MYLRVSILRKSIILLWEIMEYVYKTLACIAYNTSGLGGMGDSAI